MDKIYIIGFDIGGTTCAAILGTTAPTIIDQITFRTKADLQPDVVIADLKEAANKVMGRNSIKPDQVKAIGVSCGGPLDSRTGVVYTPPNLPNWDRVPLTDIIEKEFNIRTFIQNETAKWAAVVKNGGIRIAN